MRLRTLIESRAPAAVILIRIMVGTVFLSEGLQKFLFAADVGSGRFAKIGFAHADVVAPFVGSFEVACGLLVLLGLVTRLAVVPLIVIILTAIVTTKLPILLGADLGPFRVPALQRYGAWAMAHEARADWSMLLGGLFLLIVGAGRWSLDARIGLRAARGPGASGGR